MTRRRNVRLDQAEQGALKLVPQIIANIEVEGLSVEEWSTAAVEEMFKAADKALKDET